MTTGAIVEAPPATEQVGKASPSECADCVTTPCQCARRAMLRVAGKHLRLDKLNGELPKAIDRLRKVIGEG